jgi:superfamily II DNA or RNA helicase
MKNLVYFANHPTQGNGLHTKIGHTSGLYDRTNTMNTSFSVYSIRFTMLIMCDNVEEEKKIEELLHSEYHDDSTMHLKEYENSGTEWFNRIFNRGEIGAILRGNGHDNEIITDSDKIKEIQDEYDKERIKVIDEYNKKMVEAKRQRDKNLTKRDRVSIKDEIKWFERRYQTDIITLGTGKLNELGKFYLELATGSGKTYIVFNIMKKLNPDVLFCLSPRLKINKQNISGKYKDILGDEYLAFNLSSDKNLDEFMRKSGKKIITGCITNYKRVYDIINDYRITDNCIWFDEAHWGIEGWIDKGLNESQDFLLKSDDIQYRIYTSASPNIEKVENNENIFGELFKEITVKQLMEQKWLCNIKPFIFEVKEYNINYCKTILIDFKKYKRSWGLSFHNSCMNAFNMFLKHYGDYKNKITLIKPYLLVGDSKDINNDRRINTIYLDYDYRCFKSYEDTNNSIAYVVKKCDMGYDFENIDYISLTDKKMSYSDLIQCIGRGLRPDKKGDNGENLEKELYLMIPNYIDEDNSDNYDNLINVIQYLQYDIGLEWKDIPFRGYNSGSSRSGNISEDYNGEKIIQSKIMDAIRLRKFNWTPKKLLVYCKNNNIHNIEEYINHIKEFSSLNLPNGDNPLEFNWSETYRKHNYYSMEECKEKIKNIMEENDINDDDEDIDYYNEIDPKIPDMYLVDFYGGFRNDYPCY